VPDKDGAGVIPDTPSAAPPEASPLPVYGQNATWLTRTVETGEVEPSFVPADPPPPSPWEDTVERPIVEAAPQVTTAVVDDTVGAPTSTKTTVRDKLSPTDAAAQISFSTSYPAGQPEFLISTPSPTANPAQSPVAVDVDGAPVIEVFVP
jgi:hypothetical protein